MQDSNEVLPPPGLVGDVARFIYEAAHRQVPEIALAGAIGFIAGIVGRTFNISGTGLNHYVILLAPTGTGKEAINSGISKLIAVLTDISGDNPYVVLNADKFIGPADMASGQGLLRDLSSRHPPCYVAIVGEFTLRLKQLAKANATSAELTLLRVLLDAYNKSGSGQFIGATVYSNTANNTGRIDMPALSIIGEGTPETFYDSLTEDMIGNGLLPRFIIVEYNGQRPRRNRNAPTAMPEAGMMTRLTALVKKCMSDNQANRVTDVAIAADAEAYLDELDEYADDQINRASNPITKHLWNRAHKKGLKLSALLAVGCAHENDFAHPVVTLEHARWARHQVERDIRRLIAKFDAGDVGSAVGDVLLQQQKIIAVIEDCIGKPFDQLSGYDGTREMHEMKCVPHSYLQKRLLSMPIFKRGGGTKALKDAISNLQSDGKLDVIPAHQVKKAFGIKPIAYRLVDYTSESLNDRYEFFKRFGFTFE